MHDDDPTRPSRSQAKWQSLADSFRDALEDRLDEVPGMDADELARFADTLSTAYWLEFHAQTFDHRVSLERDRLTPPE